VQRQPDQKLKGQTMTGKGASEVSGVPLPFFMPILADSRLSLAIRFFVYQTTPVESAKRLTSEHLCNLLN